MDDTTDKNNNKKSSRGGFREGAGRPAGSKNKVNRATIDTVIEMLYDKTGRVYEDLLLEDFLNARASNEGLALKYHNLLASKLMPDLSRVDVDVKESVHDRAQAFQQAIAAVIEDSQTPPPPVH